MELVRRMRILVMALVIIGAGFGFGVYVGVSQRPAIEKVTSVYNKETAKPPEVDFTAFWTAWNILEEKYVAGVEINREELLYGAISGMVKAVGDPYTVFLPPEEKEFFDSEISGKFEGIGAEIGIRKGILTVISPLAGSPAAAAGLLAGDRILQVDDVITSDLTLDEAVKLIRGEKGTMVALTVLRGNEDATRTVEITRDTIKISIIETEQHDGGVFVIRLHSFSENSPVEFRNALQKMAESGSNRLVLDLRNNPGGFLDAAVDIASWFLESGKIVAREQFGDNSEHAHRSRGYNALADIPVVVLVNQGSASASEILAGALRDQKNIMLVGETTFGKGSVQELVPVTKNSSLKVTIARWLTPNGTLLSGNGLSVDVEVKITADDIENIRDPQLDLALELVRGL